MPAADRDRERVGDREWNRIHRSGGAPAQACTTEGIDVARTPTQHWEMHQVDSDAGPEPGTNRLGAIVLRQDSGMFRGDPAFGAHGRSIAYCESEESGIEPPIGLAASARSDSHKVNVSLEVALRFRLDCDSPPLAAT